MGTIIKPTAWDADQRPIPVTASLRGAVLTRDVQHRDRDIRYPGMLDPNYVDILQYRWYTAGNNTGTTRYWNFRTNDANKMNGIFGNYQQGNYGQGQGLYAGTRGNQILYNGTYGYWTFTAPGTTSVAQAEWTRLSHLEIHSGGPAPCIDYGLIYNTTAWRTRGLECGNFQPAYRLSCWDCNDRDGVSHDPSVKGAQFGTSVYTDTIANTSDYVGEVTLYVVDPDDPTVSLTSQAPTGWMKTPTGTISATGSDPGLGVQSMSMTNAGTVGNSDCLQAGPCPGSMSRSASVASLNLPDGNNTVNVTARDASYFSSRDANGNVIPAQHQTTADTTVKLDRGAPDLALSGTLWDARNTYVGAGRSLTLTVAATDGNASQPSTQRSGVASITATLDGQPVAGGSASQSCTRPEGSCPLTLNPTLTAAQLDNEGEGPHTVVVTAKDAVGNESPPRSFEFDYDHAEPTLQLRGSLADFDGQVLTEDSYNLELHALDTDEEVYGAGLAGVEVKLDGLSQTTSPIDCHDVEHCEQARSYTWNTTAAANGDHTITVTATDRAGNTTTETIDVELARPTPQPPRTATDQRMTINGGAGDQAGTAVTALGDLNDDGYGDYAVGAPTSAGGGRANAGSVYIVLGRAGAATIDLTNPGPGTTRIAGPGINSYCGTSVAAAGDVNGDGINDLLVGCPGMDTRLGALTQRGSAYLVFGSTSPQDIDLASIGTRGFAITGPTNSYVIGLPLLLSRPHVFGEHLRGTPQDATSVTQDVNGDGLADIIIGDSAVARNGQGAVGATYVIFGKADDATVDANNLGTAGFVVRGAGENALSGYSAAIVGDVTGDTLADIVVGAPARGATAQPAAYLIKGADSNADVDLAASAGRAVKMTAGADRLGVDATPLGDTDLDGKPDFALATSNGAYIVRTPPRSDQQLTSTDGYTVTGPTNQPLLSALIPATSVGPAGDVDQDGRADLAIGYPDASGTGRGYVVHSPEASRTLDVAALPGQRGVALAAGSQTDRSGASIAGAGPLTAAGTSDAAHTILGAPNAAPSLRVAGGQAYVMPAAPDTQPAGFAAQATASSSSSNGCYNGRETPFPFEVRNDDQFRYGYRVAVNPSGTATYGQALAVLPRCRQTIKREIDRVPTGFRKASLDYRNRPLNDAGGSSAERTWAIRDSFNDAFATVRQTTAVESGKRVIKRWEVIRRNADGSDGDVVLNSTPNGLTSVTVQGYACFVAGESTDRVMIAVRPGSSTGAGVRGFIDRSALKSTFVSNSRLEKGDTGCRSDRGLNAPLSNPAALESQNLSTETVGQETVPLVYQGKSSALNVCPENYTRLDCGARYDSYEPPAFPGIKIMALSSTGISGGDNASRAGGGVAMAVVRANAGSFARLDRLGYNDPNVPCGRTARVRWVFGNANPGRGKRGVYGWLPELASTQQPPRTCPPPG